MQRSAQAAIDEESSSSVNEKLDLEETEESDMLTTSRHNIFHTILRSPLPPQEKGPKRLGQEGFVAIAAGGETCSRMLTHAIYYILANKDRVMPMLRQELMQVMPTPDVQPELKTLEDLPYLVSTCPALLIVTSIYCCSSFRNSGARTRLTGVLYVLCTIDGRHP